MASSYSPFTIPQMEMEPDFFSILPSEIIIDILSRLPVRAIVTCKRVCKSWRGLIETHEFVGSHLSRSVPGLVLLQSMLSSDTFKIFEFGDDLRYRPVTRFEFPVTVWMKGSANGLLFLCDVHALPNALYVCNPITRDYIKLPCPQEFVNLCPQLITYGFGTSTRTGRHKVVRIFQDYVLNHEPDCHVYTLGTGSWRRVAPCAPFEYNNDDNMAFVNGSLHWLVRDLNGHPRISCFDLETELFSTFSPPPPPLLRGGGRSMSLVALEDRLCLCDNSSDSEIVIWSMKENGLNDWTKELVIAKNPSFGRESCEAAYLGFDDRCYAVYPIKVFEDGDILMVWEDFFLFYYSSNDRTTQKVDALKMHCPDDIVEAVVHTPSFLSLKSFELEDASSF